MTKKVKSRDRKVNTTVMFSARETEFLDRKVNKNFADLKSRSAIIRTLVNRAMLKPELLDVAWTKDG
jgi:hypothetical protein